jgi:hypothetical protein
MERELLQRPKHPSSTPILMGFVLNRSLVFCVVRCPFVHLLFAITLSILFRFIASWYHFVIFNLFLAFLTIHYKQQKALWEIVLSYQRMKLLNGQLKIQLI